MYKGKFDQKTKKVSAPAPQTVRKHSPDPDFDEDLTALLGDVPVKSAPPANTVPQKKEAPAAPAKKPAPSREGSAPAKKPAPVKEAPAKKDPEAPKKQQKGPRLGSVIFYTLYFLFILLFFLATYIGLKFVHNWLSDYEAAQPTYKAEQVFEQLFTDPDWGALYVSAGAKDSAYEGKDEFVNYMEEKIGDAKLTYMETSAGLSGNKKYVVRLDDEKVATFTLVDNNQVNSSLNLQNLENIADIPNWQLGSVEVFFERSGSYRIEKMDGHTAYVNDVALDDSFTIMEATTIAAEYLPEGLTGVSMCTQEVTGLMEQPTVTVIDEDGAPVEVTYDEATRTFTARTEVNTMADEQKEAALEAARINCLWMIEEVKDRAKVAKYFDASSKPYKDITTLGELWMQSHAGYEFANEEVSKFAAYGDDMFSVYVSMDLNVTRKDGTSRNFPFSKTLFFKNISGSWKVVDWTNVDVSQPVGKVRLTFMNGSEQLVSSLVSNNLKELVTPLIPVPEGKVFSGWVREDIADNGDKTLTVVFQPDPVSGKVAIPEGTVLEPMVLYALFENEDDVTAAPTEVPAEAPAETAAETTPETTEGA